MRIDLTATQTSTAAGVQAVINNIASPGDDIHLAAGTYSWSAAVTNGQKNISIFGADQTQPSATTINAAQAFNLTGQLDSNILRVSGMTLTASGTSVAIFRTVGQAVIDENTFVGGFRLDHVIFNGSSPGDTIYIGGWIEGVIDHCIIDHSLAGHLGETIILNHNGAPVAGTWDYGDYSWSHPIVAGATIHALFLEDNIWKRCPGNVDSNGPANAGGLRIVSRHNTCWGQPAGSHGSRESGGVRIQGPRLTEVYKNLCVRASTQSDQNSNYFSARSGEWISWGNRIKRYGNTNVGQVGSPHQAQSYMISAQRPNDGWLGPSGKNPWDLNQKGSFTINELGVDNNGRSYTPVAGYTNGTVVAGIDGSNSNQSGDVYATGTGGSITVGTGTNTLLLNGLDYRPFGVDGHWNDFVVLNTALSFTSNLPVPFTYITGTFSDHLTVYPNNIFGGGNTGPNQMTMGANDRWEIRRVIRYMGGCGIGTMDSSPNSSTTGTGGARLLSGTPNPRWCNQTLPGIWQWDNKYKTSQAASLYTSVQTWFQDNFWVHVIPNVNDAATHPTYPYDPTTVASSANPNTRVGADDEAWAIAPSTVTSLRSGTDMYDSVYQQGSGGYTNYPHPLISGGGAPVPFISGPSSSIISTSSTGVQTIATFTSTNISGTVSWGLFAGSWPANVALNSSTGVLATTGSWPAGDTAGDTQVTIRATNGTVHADKIYILTIQQPNTPPTNVTVTSPLDGASFVSPATVTLKSTATDVGGSIVQIQYYYGGTNLIKTIDATAVAAPYTYDWAAVAAGTYAITVTATDNQGGTTTSSPAVNITVAAAPTLPPPTIVVSG